MFNTMYLNNFSEDIFVLSNGIYTIWSKNTIGLKLSASDCLHSSPVYLFLDRLNKME